MRPIGARRRDFRCPAEGGGSELLWCGALGGWRPGGPGAAAGLGAQPGGLQGWGGPDTPRGPDAAGSRPGPAQGGRATPRELPSGEFAQQPKEGGSQRGPSKPAGNPGPKSPGSGRFLGRPPGRPCPRVTVLGPRQKAPSGDPRRGPASRRSQPRGLERGGRGSPETRGRGRRSRSVAERSGAPPGAGHCSALSGDGL